jgi:hypothetical protein
MTVGGGERRFIAEVRVLVLLFLPFILVIVYLFFGQLQHVVLKYGRRRTASCV